MTETYGTDAASVAIRAYLANRPISLSTLHVSTNQSTICICGHSREFHSDSPEDNSFTWLAAPLEEGGGGEEMTGCFVHVRKEDKTSPLGRATPACVCTGFRPVLSVKHFGNMFRRYHPKFRADGTARKRLTTIPVPPLQASILAIFETNEIRQREHIAAKHTGIKPAVPKPRDLGKALTWLVPCDHCGKTGKFLSAVFTDDSMTKTVVACADSCAHEIESTWLEI
jgi:hypothetical protein